MAVLALLLVAAAVVLWQQPWASKDSPAQPAVAFPDDAAVQLAAMAQELSASETSTEWAAALGPDDAARAWGQQIASATNLLNVEDVSWRYISGGERAVRDNGDGEAVFEVRWGDDGRASFTAVVRPSTDGELSVIGVADAADALPVWLAGSVDVEQRDGVRVVRIDGGDQDLDLTQGAMVARDQVNDLVAEVDGDVTVISTPSADVAARVLGRARGDVEQIAAVATTRDARDGDLRGNVMVLNPDQFDAMDDRAAQVVLTHEAVHVLTGAVGSNAETWVIEGFADFVALHDDTAALETSAGQILRDVASNGAPEQLPTDEQFASSAGDLGAVYESAWLAVRMLGEQHGDAGVVAFYRAVLDGQTVEQAAKAELGESVDSITEQWRDELVAEADALNR